MLLPMMIYGKLWDQGKIPSNLNSLDLSIFFKAKNKVRLIPGLAKGSEEAELPIMVGSGSSSILGTAYSFSDKKRLRENWKRE